MSAAVYRLPDEPLPSGLSRYVVDPMWPLLALMFGGNFFGLSWFTFNSFALGTQNRRRDFAIISLSIAGIMLLAFGIGVARANAWLDEPSMGYALLSLVVLKLGCAYALYMRQLTFFEVWEYYGGHARNGFPIMIAIAYFGHNLLKVAAVPELLWIALS